MIRCFECNFYTPYKRNRGIKGKCTDTREGRKPIKVDAVDHCDNAEPKKA